MVDMEVEALVDKCVVGMSFRLEWWPMWWSRWHSGGLGDGPMPKICSTQSDKIV